MKYCMVIIDGFPDRPYQRIKNKTPIEAARVPNMDRVSMQGRMGMVKTIPDGFPADSVVSTMSVLGYDPVMYYTSRAGFEAEAMEIELAENDWVLCGEFVSTFDGCLIDPCAGKIRTEESRVLLEDLSDHFQKRSVQFYRIKNHHHLMVLRNVSLKDVKTYDPTYIIGQPLGKYYPAGEGSELLVEILEEGKKILVDHEVNKVRRDLGENPADTFWPWSHGKRPFMPSFYELHGTKAAVISSSLEIQGLCKAIGFDVVAIPSCPPEDEYGVKKEYALRALNDVNFLLVHLDSVTEASKTRDLGQKIRSLEQIDNKFIGPLLREFPSHCRLMITGGRIVRIDEGFGQKGPVPFALTGENLSGGTELSFNEKNAMRVDFLIQEGEKLLPFFLQS